MLTKLGSCLVALGFALQLILPLGIAPLSAFRIGGLPGDVFLVFLSIILAVSGVILLYHGWFRHYAARMDIPEPERQ